MNLPSILSKKNLKWHWVYRDAKGKPIALVARYDDPGQKKRFHQYHLNENDEWVEGAPTPSPLFGIESLLREDDNAIVYIFEGEKCATAAHSLDLAALTSMRGSGQAHLADWMILARYRHVRRFILIPDNDEVGKKYMESVSEELKKACPLSEVAVCPLPLTEKGEDFIDWLLKQDNCPLDWDGFSPIDEPGSLFLKSSFEKLVSEGHILCEEYFQTVNSMPVTFDKEPEPIADVLSPVLSCPIQTLPKPIADWMQGLAEQMQIPMDFFAVPFLVAIGSLIGRKRALSMRPNTGWIEFPNLWGMLIGRPSVMKSPAMEAVNNPLKMLADQAHKKYEVDLKKFKADSKIREFREKAKGEVYKKKYKESLESGKSGEMPEEFEGEDPLVEPKKRRYKSDDPTVEKLGEILIENTQGILLFRDEIAGWLYSFEKTGRENDRQFFLESWSGKKDFDVDRIGRGSLHIPALFLSIFGSIQPGPLSRHVRSTIKGGVGDDGFLQRFSLMIWPDVGPDWELVEGCGVKEKEEKVRQMIGVIDRLAFDPDGQPVLLEFDEGAQKLFNEWQSSFERRLRGGILPAHLEAHFGKYKKVLPALCLIFEHLKSSERDWYPERVTEATLRDVLLWLEYLESHAHRIYGSAANAVPKAGLELIRHLRKGDIISPFSARDVYYGNHWGGLSTANEVEEVLDYLMEKGYLGSSMIKGIGRPSIKYWAHPKILEE